MTAPEIPYLPTAGFEWRVFRDGGFRLLSNEEVASAVWPEGLRRRCRHSLRAGVRCPNGADVELDRGQRYQDEDGRWQRRPRWWAYCRLHMYGRWIEGDAVLVYRQRRSDAPVDEDVFVRVVKKGEVR